MGLLSTKRRWRVEIRLGDFETVQSENVRVEAGAVIFTNGTIFDPQFVAAYGPAGWLWVGPAGDDEGDL